MFLDASDGKKTIVDVADDYKLMQHVLSCAVLQLYAGERWQVVEHTTNVVTTVRPCVEPRLEEKGLTERHAFWRSYLRSCHLRSVFWQALTVK